MLIDVRSKQEYEENHLPGAINIPLYEIEKKIQQGDLANKQQIRIIYCQSGNRSKKALEIFEQKGYESCYHIKGGLNQIQ